MLKKGDTCVTVRFSALMQSFWREIRKHINLVNVYQNLTYVLQNMKILDIAIIKVISPIILSYWSYCLTVPIEKKF